jgi:hypothetical protein
LRLTLLILVVPRTCLWWSSNGSQSKLDKTVCITHINQSHNNHAGSICAPHAVTNICHPRLSSASPSKLKHTHLRADNLAISPSQRVFNARASRLAAYFSPAVRVCDRGAEVSPLFLIISLKSLAECHDSSLMFKSRLQ